MRNVDWKALYARYEEAAKVGGLRPLEQPEFGDRPSVGVEEVKAMLDSSEPFQVGDARPRACACWTQEVMQGATWLDPERVPKWAGELSKSDPVVVFGAGSSVGHQGQPNVRAPIPHLPAQRTRDGVLGRLIKR